MRLSTGQILDVGVVAMMMGTSAHAIAPRDFEIVDRTYSFSKTESSGFPTSYRVVPASSSVLQLAYFAEKLAATQVSFDEETVEIISKGWDKLFD